MNEQPSSSESVSDDLHPPEPAPAEDGKTDGICATCGQLRHVACPHSCGCSPPEPGWRPELLIPCELCNICGLGVIRGGHRFHRLLCNSCMSDVQKLSRRAGRRIVPIGIHSLMNGAVVRGPDTRDPAHLEAFAKEFNSLNERIDAFREHGTSLVLQRCREFGLQPVDGVYLLSEYRERCTAAAITRRRVMAEFLAALRATP